MVGGKFGGIGGRVGGMVGGMVGGKFGGIGGRVGGMVGGTGGGKFGGIGGGTGKSKSKVHRNRRRCSMILRNLIVITAVFVWAFALPVIGSLYTWP